MKTKSLLLLVLCVFIGSQSFSCPIWMVGKLRVVDENNQPINVKIWEFSSKNDSFQISKRLNFRDELQDTNFYAFYAGGGWWYYDDELERVEADYAFRIQAEGYADVTIKSIDFQHSFEEKEYPVLVVKMYTGKFIKTGEQLIKINKYAYTKDLTLKDSLVLGYEQYFEALEDIVNLGTKDHNSLLAVESYPNPVLEHLTIKINSAVEQPYLLKLMDSQGKLIQQKPLTTAETKYDMQWQVAGKYILMVYDPLGNPIFSRQFIKM